MTDRASRWEAVPFDLDASCFGLLLRDDEGRVHTYERGERILAPVFSRFEHAQLFASQWPDRPTLDRGPSYDLAALSDGARTDAATSAWLLVLDVLDAVGSADDLPTELPAAAMVRTGLSRFRRAIDLLDH